MHASSCAPFSDSVSIGYQFCEYTRPSESRSPSPWPEMAPSTREDGDVEMTDSPASSYVLAEKSSHTRYDGQLDQDDAASSLSSLSSPSACSPPSSPTNPRSSPTQSRRRSTRKAAKNSSALSKKRAKVDRSARVRELMLKALSINKGRMSKEPAPDHQRAVLRMIYDEICPYPDQAWISRLAIHFNCNYEKIKNWFSNTRQKEASDFKALYPNQKYDLLATLRPIDCDGRQMNMRPSALEVCHEEEWTDEFFYEVVLINDFRMMVRRRNAEAQRDAANVLLGLSSQ